MKAIQWVAVMALRAMTMHAQSGIITQTKSFGPVAPDFQGTATFNKYSGSETVTQVVVNATLSSSEFLFHADNDNPTSEILTYSISYENTMYLYATKEEIFIDSLDSGEITLAKNDGDLAVSIDVGGSDYASHTSPIVGNAWTKTYNAGLGSFIGTDSFNWSYDIVSMYLISSSSGVYWETLYPGSASGTMSVTFYTVPEPATFVILAGSGVVFFVRRRQRYPLPT